MARAHGLFTDHPVYLAPHVAAAGRVSANHPISTPVHEGRFNDRQARGDVGRNGDDLGRFLRPHAPQHRNQWADQWDGNGERKGSPEKDTSRAMNLI